MLNSQTGISIFAALVATLASAALLALVWLVLHYSDPRIWIGIGLIMALSPFALVWKLARSEKSKQNTQATKTKSPH